jgi:hypothetical protein
MELQSILGIAYVMLQRGKQIKQPNLCGGLSTLEEKWGKRNNQGSYISMI